MERIPPTEEHESNGGQTAARGVGAEVAATAPAAGAGTPDDAATARLPALSAAGAQAPTTQVMPPAPTASPGPSIKPSLGATAREQCPVCACAVAPDQRYCVECGQRLAHARPTLMNDATQSPRGSSTPPPRKRRFNWSPSATLIAGIATLLLAMLVGVLIGHYSASGSTPKHAATPVVYVPSGGATSTTGTTGTTGSTAGAPAAAAGAAGASAGAKSGGGGHASSGGGSHNGGNYHPPPAQVGQKGTGAGYQHHEFTGHFFGAENEENAGEEEEESKGGKKKK
jgi:hypothetical protein